MQGKKICKDCFLLGFGVYVPKDGIGLYEAYIGISFRRWTVHMRDIRTTFLRGVCLSSIPYLHIQHSM